MLLAKSDFVIIDFEGEPGRSFDERRAKQSPLRDVAGMLRSFGYAAASGLRAAATTPEETQSLTPVAAAWEHEARSAFQTQYDATLGSAQAGAEAGSASRQLLPLFELEKALYELRYELSNRPDWVPIPLAAVRRLIAADAPHA